MYQIQLTKTYGINDWREDMRQLTTQCGGRGKTTTFLLDDTQIKEDSFLEDVNGLLNSGEIPNLFDNEQKAELLELVRKLSKNRGKSIESLKKLYNFFIENCSTDLHCVICASPIGDAFR